MSSSDYAGRADGELEGLAASGDREAFAELYTRHFDTVYDFSLRLLRDADEAADVAQETFLKAMAALSPKKKTAAFTTWILTIARNTALNRLRSRKTVAPSLEEAEQPEVIYQEVDSDRLGSPEEAAEANELAGLVWQAATALDPKQYSLLDLHLRQGLDSGEMAEVLGTSKNNAYVMMSRLKDGVEESITAFIMARRGRRECADLDEVLTARGTVFFDADTRKAVARHIEACPTCQEQRERLVSPTTIFGALAAVSVPLGLKQTALAEALGQWATVAGSEAARTGGFLSRLAETLRSPFTALRQAGWFAGWKGVALLVGGLLAVVAIGSGAMVLSGALTDKDGENTGVVAPADGTPTPVPVAIPAEVLDREVFLSLSAPDESFCYLASLRPSTVEALPLTEGIPVNSWRGGGTVTADPLPPRYTGLSLAEPSADASEIIIAGAGGAKGPSANESLTFGDWSLLDRSSGLASSLHEEVPWAADYVDYGTSADTSLEFATWDLDENGAILGVFRTDVASAQYSLDTTEEFTIGVRSAGGQWEGPVLTITREQLGFPLASSGHNILEVLQFVPLGGDRFVLRVGPGPAGLPGAGSFSAPGGIADRGSAVFLVGPSSTDLIRVLETDWAVSIDRASGLITDSNGKTYSLADGSPTSIAGEDFDHLTTLSPDDQYRLTVDARRTASATIEIEDIGTGASTTVEVEWPGESHLCGQFPISWAGRSTPTPAAGAGGSWSFEDVLILASGGLASLHPTMDTSALMTNLRGDAASYYHGYWTTDRQFASQVLGSIGPTVELGSLACEYPANEKLAQAWLIAREVYRTYGSDLVAEGIETAEHVSLFMEELFSIVQGCSNPVLTTEAAGQALLQQTSVLAASQEDLGDPPTFDALVAEVSAGSTSLGGKPDYAEEDLRLCNAGIHGADVRPDYIQYRARSILAGCGLAYWKFEFFFGQPATSGESLRRFAYARLQEFVATGAFTQEEVEAFWQLFAAAWFET